MDCRHSHSLPNALVLLLLLSFAVGISSCGPYSSINSNVRFDPSLDTKLVQVDRLTRDEDRTSSGMVKISSDTIALLRRLTRKMMRIEAFNPDLDSLWSTDIPVNPDEKQFNLYYAHGTLFLFSQIENVDDSIDVIGRAWSASMGRVLRDSTVLLRAGEDMRWEWHSRDTLRSGMNSIAFVRAGYSMLFSPDSSHLMIAMVEDLQSKKEKGFFYRHNIAVLNSRMEEVQHRFIDLSAIILDDGKIPPYVGVDNDGVLYVQNLIQDEDSLHLTITRLPADRSLPYSHLERTFPLDSVGYKPSIVAISNLVLSKGKGVTALLFNKERKERRIREPINGVAMLNWDFGDNHISMKVTPFSQGDIRSSIEGISTENAFLDRFVLHPGLGTSILLDLPNGDKGFSLLLFYTLEGEFQWAQSFRQESNEWFQGYVEPGKYQVMIRRGFSLVKLFLQTTDIRSRETTTPREIASIGNGAFIRELVSLSPTHHILLIDKLGSPDYLRLFNLRIP